LSEHETFSGRTANYALWQISADLFRCLAHSKFQLIDMVVTLDLRRHLLLCMKTQQSQHHVLKTESAIQTAYLGSFEFQNKIARSPNKITSNPYNEFVAASRSLKQPVVQPTLGLVCTDILWKVWFLKPVCVLCECHKSIVFIVKELFKSLTSIIFLWHICIKIELCSISPFEVSATSFS